MTYRDPINNHLDALNTHICTVCEEPVDPRKDSARQGHDPDGTMVWIAHFECYWPNRHLID